ncbi:MAG: 4Fe-4S dicluster domain-containing protein [Peptococcaceae bacterium]|nr:4Fe-4S dicluster domain-containing protein [Peptococcaceae bacterium]
MLGKEATIVELKQEVLTQVAKHAFAGDLAESREQIPFDIIPGPQANFRCCVYKEREIIRQRIRVAEGKAPVPEKENNNIVQVLQSACEGCPINRYVVTDNCQRCMSRKCQQACHFNAITIERDKAVINTQLCKECGRCYQACPYHAIADLIRPCKRSCPVDAITMDENKLVVVDETKCIHCGQCIKNCPFGAIMDRSFVVSVIDLIRNGLPVYAMLAPAIEGQFGDYTLADIAEGVRQLGFAGVYEVALAADMVADSEAKEWLEAYEEGKKMTTSCCPAFVTMVQKHYPQLKENVSTTVSPMSAMARYIREKHPGAITVFIGPCIAKKSEVIESIAQNNADYALTFEELDAMFRAKDIKLDHIGACMQQGSVYGKKFAMSGGVTQAVVQTFNEMGVNNDVKVAQCNGAAECKKALLMMRADKLPEDFIEGMVCVGGCVSGPGNIRTEVESRKDRNALWNRAETRNILNNIAPYYKSTSISLHRKK